MVLEIATDERVSSGLEDILDRWTIVDVIEITETLRLRDKCKRPPETTLESAFRGSR